MGSMSDLRFSLGQVVSTPGALRALEECGESVWRLVARHARGDYGALCEADKVANEVAVEQGGRVFSSYVLAPIGKKVWVVTEADRSVTTLLLPEEY